MDFDEYEKLCELQREANKKHQRGVETFTDLGETMLNHVKRCFHTEVIE